MLTARVSSGLILAMLATACAPSSVPETMPPEAGAGPCNAEAAVDLTGELASQERAAEAMRLTGAREFRWIPLDSAVTMDYRPARLNVELDQNNVMRTFRCG